MASPADPKPVSAFTATGITIPRLLD